MGARAYGVVGGAAVVLVTLGMGASTGIGNLGSLDPHGPLMQVPNSQPTQPPRVSGPPLPDPSQINARPVPQWVFDAVLVVIVAVGLLLLGWFVWRVARQLQRGRALAAAEASTAGTEIEEIPIASFTETVEESLDDLRGGLETDDVILECWRRLELLGEHAGAPRHDSDTSTEYVERLLQGVPEAAADLAVLARLYRSAMFSGLASEPSARAVAIESLENLSATLHRRSASGT
jgi:hypothetical protein